MPKVSILMNCYNGSQFLREALDSIYAQTYSDWEIIFVDNCSTDESANIAKSYGKRVKYHKTDSNISLGAARNFGVQFCSDYIAILDVDDIWMPNALQVLYDSITSGNFALSYGNQYLIDKSGRSIGKIKNLYLNEKGNFFPKLLMQFDIPLVASMINKKKMLDLGLNFDENIFGSEEYCLFVQMAIYSEFIAIPDFIVKYRVHNSLTSSLDDKVYKERFYTLDMIKEKNPGLDKEYPNEFNKAYARGAYYKAQHLMSQNKQLQAFKTLKEYMFVDKRYFALTFMTLFPKYIWNYVQNTKYKRRA